MVALRREFRWLSYHLLAACLFPVMFVWAWLETVSAETFSSIVNKSLVAFAMVSSMAVGLASVYGLKLVFS